MMSLLKYACECLSLGKKIYTYLISVDETVSQYQQLYLNAYLRKTLKKQ